MNTTRTFRALGNRNYRLYMVGQLVSLAGTSMQVVAQAWLVLDLTGSGTALGFTMMLQFLPITVFGMWGGAFADRFDRRRLFMLVQILGGIQALGLGLLVASGHINLLAVNLFALSLGFITAVEGPTKNALVYDIAGPDDLNNAVSLGIAMQNLARVIGPALAGIVIAAFSVEVCFMVNAASFAAVLIALALMQVADRPAAMADRPKAPLGEAVRFVVNHRQLRILIVSCGLMFAFAWEFEVTMPLLAKYTFGGRPRTLGTLLAAQGLGAMIGALIVARQAAPSRRAFQAAALTFGLALAGAAVAPNLPLETVAIAFCGAGGVALAALCSSRFQSLIPDHMRGRVMALWIVFAVGSRPLGAPVVGYVAQRFGPRYGPGLGAVVVLLMLMPSWAYLARRGERLQATSVLAPMAPSLPD